MTTQNPTSAYTALIANQLEEVRNFISVQLQCPDARLEQFLDYIKNRQGKMIRASVLLLCGKLLGELNHLHIGVAGTIEMIHAATLLHDDVIDSGSTRRFQPTANNIWGANQAVLLGDYLLSKAFLALSDFGRNDINKIITDTASTICQGEMVQNTCRGDFKIKVEDYLDVISKKTAVFFAASAQLAGIISNADTKTCKSLYDFGHNLGMAFQITDDLIDVLGAENNTGKTTGRDLENKVPTMPILKSIDFTKSQIAQFRQNALDIIDGFAANPAAKALKELTICATQTAL
ncbi:MAG: polyprenyl synthetase family protein [Planctomycetaceae bacterium]|nr:polyprenyl synthetase family protein [Planctomycetaceae bacterium]